MLKKKKTRGSVKKKLLSLSGLLLFLLIVVCSVVAVTRTSAVGHPLQQAVSFHFLFLLLLVFKVFYFFTIVFFFVFSFCFSFFVPFCNSCFHLPLFCFTCLFFANFFRPSFLKTLLDWALLVWALLLWSPLVFLFFSELSFGKFPFLSSILELLCKNLSLLLFISCFFGVCFVFCPFSIVGSPFLLFACVL